MKQISLKKHSFLKMQSLGNDFVFFSGIENSVSLTEDTIKHIAHRKFGIGCDQLLIVDEKYSDNGFVARIFNSDGSSADQCGNGLRCLFGFIHTFGLSNSPYLEIKVGNQTMEVREVENGFVQVKLGVPNFACDSIPFLTQQKKSPFTAYINNQKIEFNVVSIGNPHAVTLVEDFVDKDVLEFGAGLSNDACFPDRANIGFMKIDSRSLIYLRVYERGAGETLGCGSGACAAVACGIKNGLLDNTVKVIFPGGEVFVSWDGAGDICLTGNWQLVFKGNIYL